MAEKQKDIRSRKWLLTINNPVDKNVNHETIKDILNIDFKGLIYWCMCDEIGLESKTPHTHIFIVSNNAIKFSTIKDRFPTAHIDCCRGTNQENRDYIRKEGKYSSDKKKDTNLSDTFEEWGEMPFDRQGCRSDIEDLKSMIEQGMTNYDIINSNPEFCNRIALMDTIRNTYMQGKWLSVRRTNLEVTYIYGDTGVGKTRYVRDKYGDSNVYVINNYNRNTFDFYNYEDVIVFDEFRSSINIVEMLGYLDIYPMVLPCRYNNKPVAYTKVYIISNIPLESQYPISRQEHILDEWKPFLRRIHNVIHFQNNSYKQQVMTLSEYFHGKPKPQLINMTLDETADFPF